MNRKTKKKTINLEGISHSVWFFSLITILMISSFMVWNINTGFQNETENVFEQRILDELRTETLITSPKYSESVNGLFNWPTKIDGEDLEGDVDFLKEPTHGTVNVSDNHGRYGITRFTSSDLYAVAMNFTTPLDLNTSLVYCMDFEIYSENFSNQAWQVSWGSNKDGVGGSIPYEESTQLDFVWDGSNSRINFRYSELGILIHNNYIPLNLENSQWHQFRLVLDMFHSRGAIYVNNMSQSKDSFEVSEGFNWNNIPLTGFGIGSWWAVSNEIWIDGGILTEYAANSGQVPEKPILNPISPEKNNNGIIELNWDEQSNIDEYRIYRDTVLISDLGSLIPIATTSDSSFTDTITVDGNFYYIITAYNSSGESAISNCESVLVNLTQFTIGVWQDFNIGTNLLICRDLNDKIWIEIQFTTTVASRVKLSVYDNNPSIVVPPTNIEVSKYYKIEFDENIDETQNMAINFYYPEIAYSSDQDLDLYILEENFWESVLSTQYKDENKIYRYTTCKTELFCIGKSVNVSESDKNDSNDESDVGIIGIDGFPIWSIFLILGISSLFVGKKTKTHLRS